jgi:hypothetical protein
MAPSLSALGVGEGGGGAAVGAAVMVGASVGKGVQVGSGVGVEELGVRNKIGPIKPRIMVEITIAERI